VQKKWKTGIQVSWAACCAVVSLLKINSRYETRLERKFENRFYFIRCMPTGSS